VAYRFVTQFFNSPDAARASELEWCLQRNCESFDAVAVVTEFGCQLSGLFAQYSGAISVCPGDQQRFADALAAAAPAQVGDVVVIANADIYIPRATLALIDQNIEPGQAYCLARWDFSARRGVSLFDVDDSQDCWVFRGPPLAVTADFNFGQPGCDSRFAHELQLAGYDVLNPSRDVRTYHVHFGQSRPRNLPAYRVPLPYLCVSPHALGERPRQRIPARLPDNAGYHWS
jgi:hypothetical protein